MRFVVFGMCPYPVFQVLPKMVVMQEGGATYLCAEAAVLDQARAWELVEWTDTADRARPSSHLALVGPSDSLQIADRVQAVLGDYLEVLRAAAADLEGRYSATAACTTQRFPWAWVRHAVVGGWLMDLSLAHIAGAGSRPQARVGWRVVGFRGAPVPGDRVRGAHPVGDGCRTGRILGREQTKGSQASHQPRASRARRFACDCVGRRGEG